MNQQFTQSLTQLSNFILDSNEVGIIIGSHQNLDTVAAGLALFLSLTQSGKSVQIVSVKEPLVEVSSLVGVDKIKKSFIGNTTKLVVALPYIKGEVEKVLFTEQADTINFHLTAAPNRTITPFDLSRVKLNWEGGAPKSIITIGVGHQSELTDLIDVENSRIVNIDNYQNNSRFGEIVLVDETFSSLSEIVGKILKDERLPYDADTAQNILDGVLFATRNFTKGNTSPAAFEAASNAMYQGAQRRGESPRPQMPQNEPKSIDSGQQTRSQLDRPSFDNSQIRQFDSNQNIQSSGQRPYDVAPRPSFPQGKQNRSFDSQVRQGINQGQNRFDQSQGRQGGQRRDNRGFGGAQDRQNQNQARGSFDNSSFGNPPFDASQGRQDKQGKQRVNPNDFPAMHIQDIRNEIQNDPRMQNQRPFESASFDSSQGKQGKQNRGNDQQFKPQGQNNRVIGQPQLGVQDRGFDSNIQNQPMSSIADSFDDQVVGPRPMPEPSYTETTSFSNPQQMPEEPQNVTDYNEEDVPDDWLMPKVFKSSKNNN